MENFQYVNNPNPLVSKKDKVWNWIRDISEVKDMGSEKLVLPKNPKNGEIANLLASGYINGNISLDDNYGNHIAVGGTKSIEKKEIETFKDESGKKVTQTKVIRYSQPYLNILINDNGKAKIKQLGEDAD